MKVLLEQKSKQKKYTSRGISERLHKTSLIALAVESSHLAFFNPSRKQPFLLLGLFGLSLIHEVLRLRFEGRRGDYMYCRHTQNATVS